MFSAASTFPIFFQTGRTRWGVWLSALVMFILVVGAKADPNLVETPLAPRSGPRGATLFKAMSPAETGVVTENDYSDPKMWTDHYQELIFGEMGSGVAVGDFDNDGKPDLFVVSKTGICRLFRNLGDWKFEDVTEKSGLAGSSGFWGRALQQARSWTGGAADSPEHWKQGATFVDVNNDGWLDLYICRFGAPNLLYINQHDGTFKEEAAARGLAVEDGSAMAEFCDYDRDGFLDVFIHTNMLDAAAHPNGQRSYLFHNNGDGTFTNVTDRAGISGEAATHSATWWDFDEDGWPDLYVANDYGVPDALYRNNHDGTFTDVINRVVPHMPYYAMGADLGDINNDGHLDLFVADMAASSHEKDFRGMADARTRTQQDPPDTKSAPQYMHNVLYLNAGVGRMREAAFLAGVAATDWTWSARFEDLDNDGRIDLFVTNGMIREYHNSDLLAKVMKLEDVPAQRQMIRQSPILNERHRAFRNRGNLQFEDVSGAWGLDQVGVGLGAAFGDFDGDGDLDLAYSNYQSGVSLFRNDSDQGHRIVVSLRGTRSNRFGIGAIVRIVTVSGTQIRQLVLARGYLSSSEPILHFGLGDDDQVQSLDVAWPTGGHQHFEHLAVDRHYQITEVETAKAAASSPLPPEYVEVSQPRHLVVDSHEAPRRDSVAQPLLPSHLDRAGPSLAIADVTGAGGDDLVLGATSQDPLQIWQSDARGQFRKLPPLPRPHREGVEDGPILALDFDGDGTTDLFVTRCGENPAGPPAYQPELWSGDGHGGFRRVADALPAMEISAGAAVAADFDHDGQLDIFIGARNIPGKYPLSPRSALLAHRDGKWVDVTDTVAPTLREVGLVTAALWSDVDGDGWVDLLVATDWGPVRYFHNDHGRKLEEWTERAGFVRGGTGWWTSLSAGDFNEDGRPDYVVGNVGLNTPYRAEPSHPTLIYYGKFGSGNSPLLLEGQWEGNNLYPRRTRTELATKISGLVQKFPSEDDFAHATLADIFGQERLDQAQKFEASELRCGVFLSQPDGSYRFVPLPPIAQIAPSDGIAVGDFDGDGHLDLYVAQNSFAPMAAIGRFDGGFSQMFRGDGKGGFIAIEPAKSGLIVPGDAKALGMTDPEHDGSADFVMTRNRDSVLVFHRQTPDDGSRHRFALRLRGGAGNRSAVGAAVTVVYRDGTAVVQEVYAGSGYRSQSNGKLYYGFGSDNPPDRARVRWPDGRVNEFKLNRGPGVQVLEENQAGEPAR